jgi:hypothetical protein
MVNFILIPREFRAHQIAVIKNQCPYGCSLIRIAKDGVGYERISQVEVKTEPWFNPDDPTLKKYATNRNSYPTYLTLSEKEHDGIIGVGYPYDHTDEDIAKWAKNYEEGWPEQPIDAQGIYEQLIEFHDSKTEVKSNE